jgi:hypothetical protein
MRMLSFRSGGPASRSRTLLPGSSLRRLARTHPADPAPTMTQSYARSVSRLGTHGQRAGQQCLDLHPLFDRRSLVAHAASVRVVPARSIGSGRRSVNDAITADTIFLTGLCAPGGLMDAPTP